MGNSDCCAALMANWMIFSDSESNQALRSSRQAATAHESECNKLIKEIEIELEN